MMSMAKLQLTLLDLSTSVGAIAEMPLLCEDLGDLKLNLCSGILLTRWPWSNSWISA